MWHMMGLNPMTQDWLGVDTIFGVDVIMKYENDKKATLRLISQFYFTTEAMSFWVKHFLK